MASAFAMCASGTKRLCGIVAEDALEAVARLVFLALLEGEEAVDVEREVVLLEPGIVAEDAAEEVARDAVVELGRGAALVDGPLLPVLEALDEASRSFSHWSSPRRTSASGISRASRGVSATKLVRRSMASVRSSLVCATSAVTRASRRAWSCARSASGILGPRIAGFPAESGFARSPAAAAPLPCALGSDPAFTARSAAGWMVGGLLADTVVALPLLPAPLASAARASGSGQASQAKARHAKREKGEYETSERGRAAAGAMVFGQRVRIPRPRVRG